MVEKCVFDMNFMDVDFIPNFESHIYIFHTKLNWEMKWNFLNTPNFLTKLLESSVHISKFQQ